MRRRRTETGGAVRRSPWTEMWSERAPVAGEACEQHNIPRPRARLRLLVRRGGALESRGSAPEAEVKPATLVETGVGSAGECGLTEGSVETGATSEVAGHAARVGVQLKVLQEEQVFLASGILGCKGHPLGSSL